eukprot:2703800-Alexandrium_andersonii.AAC.1
MCISDSHVPVCLSSAVSPTVAESMARPLRGSQTAGHHSSRCSAESSPMPHNGQQPAGCGVAAQR